VQPAQRAGHHDQPAVVAQQRREGPQHPGGAEVVHLGVGVGDRARVVVGTHPHDRVVEHDVDAAMPVLQLCGEPAGGLGVGDVEDLASDPGSAAGQGVDGLGDAGDVATGQVNGVLGSHAVGEPFDQRRAQALRGAGDQGDFGCGGHAVSPA
jgi:hypothetical protein